MYGSFVDLNPMHKSAPAFSGRTIEVFEKAGFPQRVVEAKRDFSIRFALSSDYWLANDIYESPGIVERLRNHLVDLASHYHALYQDPRLANNRQENYEEARRWYRQLVKSYPSARATQVARYRLADLLLEHEEFVDAAIEYNMQRMTTEPKNGAKMRPMPRSSRIARNSAE